MKVTLKITMSDSHYLRKLSFVGFRRGSSKPKVRISFDFKALKAWKAATFEMAIIKCFSSEMRNHLKAYTRAYAYDPCFKRFIEGLRICLRKQKPTEIPLYRAFKKLKLHESGRELCRTLKKKVESRSKFLSLYDWFTYCQCVWQ